MRVLLDTCVLSELRHPQGSPDVRRAVEDLDSENLFLSIITTGEISKSIALLTDGRRKRGLQEWFLTLQRFYADRILSIDLETSQIWGELTAAAQPSGSSIPASDGLIAATALRHGLHLMTRNTVHFAATHVLLLNPWEN
jgi:toxin FitB